MILTDWRVYLASGAIVDAHQTGVRNVPTFGVLVISQPDMDVPGGWSLLHSRDWYWWRPDLKIWCGGDLHGWLDQAMHCGAMWPKQGRTVQNKMWQEVMERATAERPYG